MIINSTCDLNRALQNPGSVVEFPVNTHLWLLDGDTPNPQALTDLEKAGDAAQRLPIVVSLGRLANAVSSLISDNTPVVGIGTSGTKFARRVDADAPTLPIETIEFDTKRAERKLRARIDKLLDQVAPGSTVIEADVARGAITAVDDVMVSGKTIACARQALEVCGYSPVRAVVGIVNQRKAVVKLAGRDVAAALSYSGSLAPTNSVSTVFENATVAQQVVDAFYGGNSEVINILRRL